MPMFSDPSLMEAYQVKRNACPPTPRLFTVSKMNTIYIHKSYQSNVVYPWCTLFMVFLQMV